MYYIFINPVVRQMYEKNQLETLLKRNGYEPVEVCTQWGEVVREKYRKLAGQTEKTVLDARCPLVLDKIQNYLDQENCHVADIHPILIHCAMELAEREELRDRKKLITTPCTSLAEYGNALHLKDTEFVSWRELLEKLDGKEILSGRKLEESPIPLGFFDELDVKTDRLCGENVIQPYFQQKQYRDAKLVEMLWCNGGCINGDGVMFDEHTKNN